MEKRTKILIVLLFSNGDCLLSEPILSNIKKRYPNAHITWNVASFSKNFLLNNPNIDSLIEVNEVAKYDIVSYRKYKLKIELQVKNKLWDKVYFLQLTDTNQANYDGCIRSMLYNSYGEKVETSVVPKIYLTKAEVEKALAFFNKYNLNLFEKIILFEFAPQSGQLVMSAMDAIEIAYKITSQDENVAIVMSSSSKLDVNNKNVIDGSELGIRETGAFMKHCHLLLGCSSGLSWMATSNIGNNIPLIQIINPQALWVNPMSRDFERFRINQPIIELYEFNKNLIVDCVKMSLYNFDRSKLIFQKKIPICFNTTKETIYNLLCYFQFKSIYKHIKLNIKIFGFHHLLVIAILEGFLLSPFKLLRNLIIKNL
jgi:hypothetical protein